MNLVGIDFEMANAIPGSLCAFGMAFEDGTTDSAILRLHTTRGGVQERDRWHHISPKMTMLGEDPEVLYNALKALPSDTVLLAHDARIDKRQLYAWYEMWDFTPIDFPWLDTLLLARREFGKQGKTGVAAMAERLGMTVKNHDAVDDARVALKIAQTYDWGKFVPMLDGKAWKM